MLKHFNLNLDSFCLFLFCFIFFLFREIVRMSCYQRCAKSTRKSFLPSLWSSADPDVMKRKRNRIKAKEGILLIRILRQSRRTKKSILRNWTCASFSRWNSMHPWWTVSNAWRSTTDGDSAVNEVPSLWTVIYFWCCLSYGSMMGSET